MVRFHWHLATLFVSLLISSCVSKVHETQWHDRPLYLIEQLEEGELKADLQQCIGNVVAPNSFTIGHRGAPIAFPEHTKPSYLAAIAMGAGIVECDVVFTKDGELVCRHDQCDLHKTTDILLRPSLASKCKQEFKAAVGVGKARVQCCTSDINLHEFKTLCGRVDQVNTRAKNVSDYLLGESLASTADNKCAEVMSFKEHLQLLKQHGRATAPELKVPKVRMPYKIPHSGKVMTVQGLAQQVLDELEAEEFPEQQVYLHSVNLREVQYWLATAPHYADTIAWLDKRYRQRSFNPNQAKTFQPNMEELYASGLRYLMAPTWFLVKAQGDEIVPTIYAQKAQQAGLKLIAWTLETSGSLEDGGDRYYRSVRRLISNDGDTLKMLDALVKKVGVVGVFSDWPATTSYYANCRSQ